MKHSPAIELAAAKRALEVARENCPHWDYEKLDGDDEACCFDISDAERRFQRARNACNPR